MLAKQYQHGDALSVLRAQFSPAFSVSEKNLRPVIALFNKLKTELPSEKFRLLIGLFLQIHLNWTSPVNRFSHILVSGRVFSLLPDRADLAFELNDLVNVTAERHDHCLNMVENHRKSDSRDARGTEWTASLEDGTSAVGMEEPNDESRSISVEPAPTSPIVNVDGCGNSPSVEFRVSRGLYQQIPGSLNRSSLHNDVAMPSVSKKLMQHVARAGKADGTSNRSMVCYVEEASTGRENDVSDVDNRSAVDAEGEEAVCMTTRSDDPIGRLHAKSIADEVCVQMGDITDDTDATSYSPVRSGTEVLAGDDDTFRRGRKRVRRLGAREKDMMLRQVGSHCIMIGVKDLERVANTDSSDNQQSESETQLELLETSSRITSHVDSDGSLTIEEDGNSSYSKRPKRLCREKRRWNSKTNLVKVTSLCRAAARLDKHEKRKMKTAMASKAQNPEGTLSKARKERAFERNENTNNSCSLSDLSDEDTLSDSNLNRPVACLWKIQPIVNDTVSEDSSNMDVCSSQEYQQNDSEIRGIKYSNVTPHERQGPKGCVKNVVTTRVECIQPFAAYLGLKPAHVESASSGRYTPFAAGPATHNSNRKKKRSGVKPFYRSRSGVPTKQMYGYDSNFPFTDAAFSTMSSIAESASFMGSSYMSESSQDALGVSESDMASSQASIERDRAYGLGTFAQDNDDDHSFLNRLLRSPSPPRLGAGNWKQAVRRRRRPKKERKSKKPRRSRRLRKESNNGSDYNSAVTVSTNNVVKDAKGCSCCS